jgi:uncharacterized protein (TIRG00374 family)
MSTPAADAASTDGRRRRLLRWGLALALAGLVAFVAVSVAAGLAGGASALGRADLAWLGAAMLAEVGAYLLLALQLRRLIGRDVAVSGRTALRLTMVLCGFGCITPASPAEGMVITGGELRRRGMPLRRVTVTLGLAEFVSALAMAAVAALNVLAAGALSDLPSGGAMPLLAVALVALAALAAVDLFARRTRTAERIAVILGALCFWRPRPPVEVRRAAGAAWQRDANEVLGSTSNRLLLVSISAAAWLADVVCLYFALAALGITLPFDVVILAYTVGVLATLVPLLPAGLGLVETAVPLVLHSFGAPLAAAVAAVVVYRCVSTLGPAAVGLACIPRLAARRSGTTPAPVAGSLVASSPG